ncbi:MAG TPA: DUF72 domain-containing protein [Puia sp.]|jgi:uncharacterized protein YecE (DUF72 family)
MEFGRTVHIEEIDFSLPPDDPVNELLWQRCGAEKQQPVRLYVGCTQWGRTDWVGKVYPKGTKQKDFLAHYLKQFNCIELNTLFYGLQPKEVIQRWASLADDDFRFCPKMSESISHRLQLRNAQDETKQFIDHISAFGDRLGTAFLQLSENFGPDRAALLQDYLRSLPRDFRLCVELRHKDWFGKDGFKDSAADTCRIMMENNIGTVITDTAGRRDVLHMRLTAPVVFIRWVGNSLHPTDFPRIEAWAHRLRSWMDKGLREIYFIVHNHNELLAPDLEKYAVERFNAICGTSLKPPRLTIEPPSLTLF